jgi:hypothetical protein
LTSPLNPILQGKGREFSEGSATTNWVCCQGSSPNKFNLFSLGSEKLNGHNPIAQIG